VKYFQLSADQNSSPGQGNHGKRMLEDRNCSADPVRVAQDLKAAAGQGDIHEASNYGLCMFDGNGAKSDPVEAGAEKSTISMPKSILTISGSKVATFPVIISPQSNASNWRLTRIIRLDNSILVQTIPGAKMFQ
jgi:hypothetical protein